MRIAIDIPRHYPPVWKIAAGALEYESRCKMANSEEVTILLPWASLSTPEDKDPSSWDAVIKNDPNPELTIPQVLVFSGHEDQVSVTVSEDEIGRLAVDQFISMGLNSLVFFGRTDWGPVPDRWRGFSQYAESRGMDPVFISSKGEDNPEDALYGIPKPCGILAFNDGIAKRLLKLCKSLGLQVPRDVHIISVDNSPTCLESTPTLSSIAMSFDLVGYHAAQLCHKIVKGESVESIQVPPSALIIRDSTKVEKDDIRSAASVAHYLRTNLSYPIQMEDVVRRSSISRRRLEQIFRSAYGASPIAYLRELRLEQAKEMLGSGDAPLKKIVEDCGYSNAIHLCHIFKKTTGLTPMDYRQTHGDGHE